MPAPQNLSDVYVDELRDLWSANDQMHALAKDLIAKDQDATLKSLLKAAGGEVSKEHCRAMEGLVREARMHGLGGFGTAACANALGRSGDAAASQSTFRDMIATRLAERLEEGAAT